MVTGPVVAGRPGAATAGMPAVSTFTPELTEADLLVHATETAADTAGASLATARVVVGGGRGVGGPEGFAALEELAALLGGVVGVSRVVTSAGWRPHRQQVGQTGTKISPELYLACGISGAIQHMAGCQSARHIIAINTDAGAPIIARARVRRDRRPARGDPGAGRRHQGRGGSGRRDSAYDAALAARPASHGRPDRRRGFRAPPARPHPHPHPPKSI